MKLVLALLFAWESHQRLPLLCQNLEVEVMKGTASFCAVCCRDDRDDPECAAACDDEQYPSDEDAIRRIRSEA